MRLLAAREQCFDAFDAALARGLADADAGRVHPVAEVFSELKARYRSMAEQEGAGE
ncbi:MAG TPA: hypothetical protein VK446_11215 [Methylocystis sp.]|nr:hypothetical protein [Methylocystis sp.]